MNELILTTDQEIKLKMYIQITTRYRKGEMKACESLGKELDENGALKFPDMLSNAKWWEECDETLNEILNSLNDF